MYRLERAESLGEGLRRVIAEQAALAREQLRDPDPLRAAHEGRRRGKEIRAALRLLRDDLPGDVQARARASFVTAARQLAAARDSEVAGEALAALRRHRRLLRVEREAAERRLAADLDAARAGLTPEALGAVGMLYAQGAAEVAAAGPLAGDGFARALRRLYGRGRDRMREAQRQGSAEAFHGWRHDAKDLWYAVRLLAPAWEGPLDALAGELRELGKLLGDEHDLTILRDALARDRDVASSGADAGDARPPALTPGLLTPRLGRAIAARQGQLRAQALALGARLYVERPRELASRLVSLWRTWSTAPPPGA